MLDYKLKIGLIPERRYMPDHKTRTTAFRTSSAMENKEKVLSFIKTNFADENTEFVDLEWLNDEGMLHENGDVDRIKDEFVRQAVDAIFIINCNFGNEEAAGQIAYKLKLPTLLWGPQDMEFDPSGVRYTDTQCGLFAISKQLRRLKVPFSYIENCPVEAPQFTQGFENFLSVACMVKNFKNLKVTQVGTRLNAFKSVMSNELELTEKFGINISTVNLSVFRQKLERLFEEKAADLEKDLAKLKSEYNVEPHNDDTLKRMLCMVYAYKEVFDDNNSSVLTSECWSGMPQTFGVCPCLAMSILADQGYIVVCESDICGAITQALLSCAARGKKIPLFGEFTTRHPENKNAELIWHCGPFAYSMKKEGEEASLPNGRVAFRAKDGDYTIARFQGDAGNYTFLGGTFKTCDGPKTGGTYIWGEFSDLARIERKFIEGPYIHHMSEMEGFYKDVIKEFCKFIPELTFDDLED